jgi:hypothetical protein
LKFQFRLFCFYLEGALNPLSVIKSTSMKSSAQPALYFSAYPLKAVSPAASAADASANQSPYLRSILAGKTKTVSRVRVFAMVNPYGDLKAAGFVPKPGKLPKDIELTEKDWFKNYE